jgi:hypothetical protein
LRNGKQGVYKGRQAVHRNCRGIHLQTTLLKVTTNLIHKKITATTLLSEKQQSL